jgi:D-glycero-D-manno-heptose 1,7-bisphosphate phosphatase
MPRKALFLDRDGVINVDHGYCFEIERIEFIDGIFELCEAAHRTGLQIVVVTNQAGVARGFYTEQDVRNLHRWMKLEFEKRGVPILDFYYCLFHPEAVVPEYAGDSFDRKPNPGMLLRAKEEHDIAMQESIMVGDKPSDMVAGRRARVATCILFDPVRPPSMELTEYGYRTGSLRTIAGWLQE